MAPTRRHSRTVDVVAGCNTSAVALASAGSLTGTVTDYLRYAGRGRDGSPPWAPRSGLTFIATTGASGAPAGTA